MKKQKYLELNENEKDWIAKNLSAVKGIIQSTLGIDEPDWLQPKYLDLAYKAWFTNHDCGSEDPNPMINAIGIAFGEYLNQNFDLRWIIVQEKKSAEIAVHGEPGDILLFPPNLVAKRYEEGMVDFFVPLVLEMEKAINEIRDL